MAGRIITSDGSIRITETGDTRVTEDYGIDPNIVLINGVIKTLNTIGLIKSNRTDGIIKTLSINGIIK